MSWKWVDVLEVSGDRSLYLYRYNQGSTYYVYNDQGLYFRIWANREDADLFLDTGELKNVLADFEINPNDWNDTLCDYEDYEENIIQAQLNKIINNSQKFILED